MRDTVYGRIGYLLALATLLHFIYPITLDGGPGTLILYQLLYAGVFVASDSRAHLIASLATAAFWRACAVVFALDPAKCGRFWLLACR